MLKGNAFSSILQFPRVGILPKFLDSLYPLTILLEGEW